MGLGQSKRSYDIQTGAGNEGQEIAHTSESGPQVTVTRKESAGKMAADSVRVVLCKEGEMKDKEMKEFEVEGAKVVLIKDGGTFHAIGGKCTHYGAPLCKGAYSNGHVRCPWHGALFSVTGDIEDFPGLDSVPSFPVEVANGEVSLTASKAALAKAKHTKPMAACKAAEAEPGVVIVGGGAAGITCAETLRQEDFNGNITIVAQENFLPYDRPKLSKALDTVVELRKEEFYKENHIKVLLKTTVEHVNTQSKQVKLSDGQQLTYTSLVIATGGKPRTLSCPGSHLDNLIYLRTPEDGKRIAQLAPGKKIVVIGSSFIGMELASLVVKKAASLTAIDALEVPFQMVLGKELGGAFQKLYESNGVHFRLGSGVKELTGDDDGKVTGVMLTDGSIIEAELVIAGIGVVPATDFLKDSGINLNERGFIPVDKFMKTNVDNVYAAGDIVMFPLSTFGDQVANIQHWQMALKHGQIAGKSIAGKPESLHSVPFFWTVLFGKSLRYTGYGYGYDDVIIHGSLDDLKFVAYFLKHNKVVAVGTLNRDPITAQVAEVFYSGHSITREDVEKSETDDWTHLYSN